MQSTYLKFGAVWILYPEVSEFGIYPLKFGVFEFYTLTFVRGLFSLAHRPKDPGPNSCVLVDWAWFTAAKWGLITNQVVRKSHKSPQGKNVIPPKQ